MINEAPFIKDKEPVYAAYRYRWACMVRGRMPPFATNKLALAVEKHIPEHEFDMEMIMARSRSFGPGLIKDLFLEKFEKSTIYVVHKINCDQIWSGGTLLEEVPK